MSLPDNIVGYRTSSGIQRFMETSDWHQECAELWPNYRFYCASDVVSQLAIESTKRELKLADLELQVKAMKGTFTAQKAKRVEICRKAGKARAEKAVRGKNGRFVKAQDVAGSRQSAPVADASSHAVDAFSYAMQCARKMQEAQAMMVRLNNHPANTPQSAMIGWDLSKSTATPLRRYIPERPWCWHLWMWLKVEVWEKFVLGRQS